MLAQQSELALQMLDSQTYKPLTEIIYEYLLTGKTSDAPKEWFGKVATVNLLGKPAVIAIAAEGSNIKDLAEQFKGELHKSEHVAQ